MLRVFSSILFLISLAFASSDPEKHSRLDQQCRLSSKKDIISLSAPATWILMELDLLEDKALKAVSSFHFTGDSQVRKISGGLFLSPKEIDGPERTVIFFDESRELKRNLGRKKKLEIVQIESRGEDPFSAHKKAVEALLPYLENCEEELLSLSSQIKRVKIRVSSTKPPAKSIIFFLGELQKGRKPPKMIMGMDGFVKYLKEEIGMRTYPSELAYIPWSNKILKGLKEPIKVGVNKGATLELRKEVLGSNTYNLFHAGALSPGLGQIRFLSKLIEEDFFKKKENKQQIEKEAHEIDKNRE